jgi:hypothetical protein
VALCCPEATPRSTSQLKLELKTQTMRYINYPKLILAGVFTLYFAWIAYDPMRGSFLDIVDLPIHAAGHLIFRILGEFMGIAGGSLFQVIVPAIFVGYFWWHEKYYSAAIVLFWVGQSILNVYVYAADAVVMQIVLISGLTGSEGSFHDCNYMLTELGLINYTKGIAGMLRLAGAFTIIAAAALSIYYSFVPPVEEYDEI